MERNLVRTVGATMALAALAACGGGDSPTDPDNGGGPPPPNRVVKANPSFGVDIQEIFDRRGCSASQCHGTAAGLTLTSGTAHGELVNVPSTSEPQFDRVVPNDAANSYLVIKLEGRQSVGERMPRGLSPLDTIDMNNIKNWINTGAANN